MSNNVEISIIMTTYNQEMYVEKAIQSALNQKTDFYYEILIGDDFSTDNTKEICLTYAQKFENIITLDSRTKNIGLINNYADLIKKAQGKYIAILEGDDYWIDLYKLQKQYDFLENNDYGLVYTNSYLLDQGSQKIQKKYNKLPPVHSGDLYDLLLKDNHIVAITICFEREFIVKKISEDYQYIQNFKTIDYYILLMISKSFKIAYLDEVTSVYRVHDNSISNTINFEKKHIFLKSSYAIRELFLKKEKADSQKKELFLKRYFYDLFFISLEYEIIGVSKLDVDTKKINNKLLYIYFKFKIIRKLVKVFYFCKKNSSYNSKKQQSQLRI